VLPLPDDCCISFAFDTVPGRRWFGPALSRVRIHRREALALELEPELVEPAADRRQRGTTACPLQTIVRSRPELNSRVSSR
jgi:hypothetical protein